MIALIQRVTESAVRVDNEIVGEISAGLMALIGVEKTDTEMQADRLLERVLTYRVFPDEQGRMNLSLNDTRGGLLLVPQFTLVADTRKGNRPSFTSGASPEHGKNMFDYLLQQAKQHHHDVQAGRFGADMQVSLVNDGPVTFWLQVSP